jgi:hypothetical protein
VGIYKDIFDILKENPEVWKATAKTTRKALSETWLWLFPKRRSLETQEMDLRTIVTQLTEKDFVGRFPDHLDYFGVLLATTAQIAYIKRHGVLVGDFYYPQGVLYFPVSSGELSLINDAQPVGGAPVRKLKVQDGNDDGRYTFYVLLPEEKKPLPSFEDMCAWLDNLVKQQPPQGEEQAFTARLRTEGVWLFRLDGIAKRQQPLRLEFTPAQMGIVDLGLSFTHGEQTRVAIKRDLERVLQFSIF